MLKSGPQSGEELAQAIGMHAPSLYRVLRALVSVGVFAEDDRGRFVLTPLAATLRTDVPGSLGAYALTELGEHYSAWGEVLHSVKTGEIAFDHLFGMNVWQYHTQHPEVAQLFDAAMANFTAAVTAAILASDDFSSIGTLVDVGGGDGGLMAAILKAHPQVKGILFDAPHIVAGARRRMETEGLAERCEISAGSFFVSVPSGGDTYVLKNIIVDWDEERSVKILPNCHRPMAGQGKLLVIEPVILPGAEHARGQFIDLVMLVMTGGRGRTEAEHRALLAAAGFRLTRLIPTPSDMSIIEAVRA
ncbi:MAG TPA: methyltransferase [Candidatus Binatia bacterium]|nr:methyltransferase [Candidatus Binatia bacterium]